MEAARLIMVLGELGYSSTSIFQDTIYLSE
jgi:hypothetical protein